MSNYGMPYMGSKDKIALDIIKKLPSGKRLVDLFGGGGSITHCACLSGKYDKVLYNELNPLIYDVFKRAIKGEFNYKKFTPEFITRKKYEEFKKTDGYVALCWSFGNNIGKPNYLYNKNIEKQKESMHNFVVFKKKDELIKSIKGLVNAVPDEIEDISVRRKLACNYMKNNAHRFDLQNLENLERLERLENLERLERLQNLENLERLEIKNYSYENYEYQEGDIVYCDIPYENTEKYNDSFDHNKFYNWVATRDYPVFFSSYDNISDNRFHLILYVKKRQTISSTNNQTIKNECLYCNDIAFNKYKYDEVKIIKYIQTSIFEL